MKGERRKKRSSACAPAEAAIERQLSTYPAANYRPTPAIEPHEIRTFNVPGNQRAVSRSAHAPTFGWISYFILTSSYCTPRNAPSAAGYLRLVDVILQERAMDESGDERADDGRHPEDP
jgi:hypothetical protein